MSKTIALSKIETAVQNELRNTVNSPITQGKRVEAFNRTIDLLQGRYHWDTTKRVSQFEYLQGETDYSILNDLGLTDFKGVQDIRIIDTTIKQLEQFEDIAEIKFNILRNANVFANKYTIEERDNDEILRMITNFQKGKTIVTEADDLTANGTWASDTTNSDATTLEVDTVRKKTGSGSFKFNIDVSQSVNNYAQIATTTVLINKIDGSSIENTGHFRCWLDLQSITAANLALITNIELRWGSSSSAYWYDTTSTAINAGSLIAGQNRIDFAWKDANKTGSPDASELDYFEIRINYSSGFTDTNNIRIDDLVMLEPIDMELVYFSQFMVLNGTTRQVHFTTSPVATSELLLLPDEHFNTFVKLALKELFPQKERNNEDYLRVSQEGKEGMEDLSVALGNEIHRESQTLKPEGHSTGRVDSFHTQW